MKITLGGLFCLLWQALEREIPGIFRPIIARRQVYQRVNKPPGWKTRALERTHARCVVERGYYRVDWE
jgi:hypothetical protein